MTGIVEYLLANPIYLAPILFIVAMLVFAILKKLLKLAVIMAIAAGLYLLLVRYVGGGP
jgi:hypothetical protein